uniref:DNA mismatch repair ATPase n=1 Tax=Marseillevirus LCMAC201 TaxID=2506605 RepID=A0A481YXJ0_9VIRU|nr:MAG: DNA mismatch repair ATPase [Marseillevirus LCMAC201]
MKKAVIFEEYYTAQEELESEYGPQSIVLMMVGSFYEIYGVDLSDTKIGNAEEAHSILGMNMTMKSKARAHSRNNPYMVGFPDYALDEHLGKFLRANMTVAIYDQYDICYTDSNGTKKTKKGRKRTHVYTPSTYIDDTSTETNCLLAFELTEYKSVVTKQMLKKVHIAVLSLSTGKSYLLEAYDTNSDTGRAEAELYRIIHTYNPSEVIYCGKEDLKFAKLYDLGRKKVYFRTIPKTYRKSSYQNEFLKSIYVRAKDSLLSPIEYIGMEKHASVLPHFIQALQFAYEQDKLIVSRIQKPVFVESTDQLVLNNDSIYQLNLIESSFEDSNTLYEVICKARTAMGKRYIREQLLTPTMNVDTLNSRYDLIEKMQELYKEYDCLRGIADIEKKYRKMVLGTLHPYELADLRGTWSTIKSLLGMAAKMFDISPKLVEEYECFYNEYIGNFDFAMMKRCKLHDVKGSFFLEGVNKELDKMDVKLLDGKKVLHELAVAFSQWIEPEKECIVKVDSTEKEGWYLSTTKNRFKKLSVDFTTEVRYHSKTYTISWDDLELVNLKNTVKIRSPQIRRISRDITSQRERMNQKITEEYLGVLDHYTQDYGEMFIQLADAIAFIDFIYSAARVSIEYGYTRPQIKNKKGESYINIKDLRHPIIEQINDQEYVTNDISLGIKDHYGSLVYGLNMCGKTSLLRGVGCNIVLAQAGMFVSCRKFEFYPFRHLLSKMTIRDNMSKGHSTFMVEMIEVKNMLMRADPNTLVLSDELCSSTESTSGHAIVAQTIHSLTQKKAKFMFSTHLHELQQISLVTENPHVKIYHFKVHIKDTKIIFDRHIEEGGMTDLYGLEVARALGLPEEFMMGAFTVRDQLTEQPSEILSTKQSRHNAQLYVHSCSNCGSAKDLHTHHLRHQKDADKHGLIDGKFHKNRKFNLEVLCKTCHKKEHSLEN